MAPDLIVRPGRITSWRAISPAARDGLFGKAPIVRHQDKRGGGLKPDKRGNLISRDLDRRGGRAAKRPHEARALQSTPSWSVPARATSIARSILPRALSCAADDLSIPLERPHRHSPAGEVATQAAVAGAGRAGLRPTVFGETGGPRNPGWSKLCDLRFYLTGFHVCPLCGSSSGTAGSDHSGMSGVPIRSVARQGVPPPPIARIAFSSKCSALCAHCLPPKLAASEEPLPYKTGLL